jgi:predicted regulator of Ras-like GTPase activity (Roadblock/LC7/MglB family)
VNLGEISSNFPDDIKQEIAGFKISGSDIAIPVEQLGPQLKAGKVVFTWKQLTSWLKPSPLPVLSPHEEMLVELPLAVIAPRFFSQHRPAAPQKKVNVGDNIPDLFAGRSAAVRPSPAPPAEIVSQAAPTAPPPAPPAIPAIPTPAGAAASLPIPPTPRLPEAPAPIPSSAALPTPPAAAGATAGARQWNPQEVVRTLGRLNGVGGAILAMSDGLLIAGEIPAPFQADTVAAFLPQMFARMNGYSKEAQLGELRSMTLNMAEGTWTILKTGNVYLGALGKKGMAVPLPQLEAIATEFSKQAGK